MSAPISGEVVLEAHDINIHFKTPKGIARVVNGVDLRLEAGKMSGLVGESGSGKSVTSRSILGLLPRGALAHRSGSVMYAGRDLFQLSEPAMRRNVRGREIAMVFQDPMTALNPVMKIGQQISLPMRHHLGLSRKDARKRSLDLLAQVGIPDAKRRLGAYPHELSGGQRQRVMIAIALSCDPKVLIADEPTTALDVTVQAQILDLFDRLREERGLAILLVSHDLTLIAERCDEVSVMYAGRIVEHGVARQVFDAPEHPYSLLLERARPRLEDEPHTQLQTVPGRPPDLVEEIVGCAFRPRCPRPVDACVATTPTLVSVAAERRVSCWNHGIDAHELSVDATEEILDESPVSVSSSAG